ncbi:hypothetical protein [Methylococcus geothermalis]|uniref:Uncharacterized protein n=1 Tax=Methylococcus geothermalis TaxID=2681310 RepID=A0A858Q6E4_9GAMM|nr:hypothetical protein [Methylococcus geothermalis]QJD29410.1 hypothetical protein GNH96_05155 [Methylococcus geothermalis]
MTFKCALLCMHGMGNLTKNEFQSDIAKLRQNLAERLSADRFSEIYIPTSGIFYSDLTQQQEDGVWQAMTTQGGLNTGFIRRNTINRIRRFIISGFSDATAFTGFNGSITKQQYTNIQQRIYNTLTDIHNACGEVPIIIISHSLGCQIMSSYIWDAQIYWRNTIFGTNFVIDSRSIWKNHKSTNNDSFLCLQSLKTWFTTGCNIPIFVSGFRNVRAIHNREYDYDFDWINYFDYDDVLGYPLAPLGVLFDSTDATGHGQSYTDIVTDIQVNANDGIWGAITSSWNPMSHTQYWGDNTVLKALASTLG